MSGQFYVGQDPSLDRLLAELAVTPARVSEPVLRPIRRGLAWLDRPWGVPAPPDQPVGAGVTDALMPYQGARPGSWDSIEWPPVGPIVEQDAMSAFRGLLPSPTAAPMGPPTAPAGYVPPPATTSAPSQASPALLELLSGLSRGLSQPGAAPQTSVSAPPPAVSRPSISGGSGSAGGGGGPLPVAQGQTDAAAGSAGAAATPADSILGRLLEQYQRTYGGPAPADPPWPTMPGPPQLAHPKLARILHALEVGFTTFGGNEAAIKSMEQNRQIAEQESNRTYANALARRQDQMHSQDQEEARSRAALAALLSIGHLQASMTPKADKPTRPVTIGGQTFNLTDDAAVHALLSQDGERQANYRAGLTHSDAQAGLSAQGEERKREYAHGQIMDRIIHDRAAALVGKPDPNGKIGLDGQPARMGPKEALAAAAAMAPPTQGEFARAAAAAGFDPVWVLGGVGAQKPLGAPGALPPPPPILRGILTPRPAR